MTRVFLDLAAEATDLNANRTPQSIRLAGFLFLEVLLKISVVEPRKVQGGAIRYASQPTIVGKYYSGTRELWNWTICQRSPRLLTSKLTRSGTFLS